MHNVYSNYGIFVPEPILLWLATSDLRLAIYRLQSLHVWFRLAHILSVTVFFGAILLLDTRLMGFRRTMNLRALAALVLPWTYWSFAVAMVSGLVLFLFDPIQVGSHTYFVPKLILIALGVVNAALFNYQGLARALAATGALGRNAGIAGAVSIVLWGAAIACATLNQDERPMLRRADLNGTGQP